MHAVNTAYGDKILVNELNCVALHGTHKERGVLESGRLGCSLAVHRHPSLQRGSLAYVSRGQGKILDIKWTVMKRNT